MADNKDNIPKPKVIIKGQPRPSVDQRKDVQRPEGASRGSKKPPDNKPPVPLSVTALVAKLSSKDPKDWYRSLVEMRSRVMRLSDGVQRIQQRGGPQALLNVLEKADDKSFDVCLSILGNCCMDDKFRTEVIQRDGVAVIGVVLQETKSPSVQNRSCRTLANIALDPVGCQKIHTEESLLECIVKVLAETKDKGSQQTFIRIIRVLSDTKEHRIAVLHERGLKIVADLLKSEDNGIMMAALKTVSHYITTHPTEQCALQLDLAETCKFMVNYITEVCPDITDNLLNLILIMMKHECFRPGLGNAGCIQLFIDKITDDDIEILKKQSYVNALCLFCKESLNRVRIREQKGLEMLLEILRDDAYKVIHVRVISACCCFLYDEPSFVILLENDIVSSFVKHLKRCTNEKFEWGDESKSTSLLLDEHVRQLLDDIVIESGEEAKLDKFDAESEEDLGSQTITSNSQSVTPQAPDEGDIPINTRSIQPESDTGLIPEISINEVATENDNDMDQSEIVTEKRSTAKYSMDSPTYKEITETHSESNYDPTGPTNIHDRFDVEGSSPIYRSPSHSPGSPFYVPNFNAESYSPLSGVSEYASPDWSPCSSPKSDVTFESPMKRSHSETGNSPSYVSTASSPLHVSHTWPSQFSPLHVNGYESPTRESSGSVWSLHDSEEDDDEDCESRSIVLEYSSEEEIAHGQPDQDQQREQQEEKHSQSLATDMTYPGSKDHSNSSSAKSSERNSPESNVRCSEEDELSEDDQCHQLESDDDEDTKDPSSTDKKKKVVTAANILMFLSRISFMDNRGKHLANNLVIEGLLEYLLNGEHVDVSNWSRAQRVLFRILKYAPILDKLILAGIPMILVLKCAEFADSNHSQHGKKSTTSNSQAKRDKLAKYCLNGLSLLAQQRYGMGVMKHVLMTGSMSERMKAYFSIPLLYSDRKDLVTLFKIMPHGFDIVIHCLSSEHDILNSSGVIFISFLASSCFGHRIYQDWPHHEELPVSRKRKRSSSPDDQGVEHAQEKADLDVSFQLPDGTLVKASRGVMVSSSTVFKNMLDGSYSESQQSCIKIADVNSTAFTALIKYLHTTSNERDKVFDEIQTRTLCELLILIERYHVQEQIHMKLCLKLEEQLEKNVDPKGTCAPDLIRILQTSLVHNCPYLTDQCLKHALGSNFALSTRINTIKACLSGDEGLQQPIIMTCFKNFLSNIF